MLSRHTTRAVVALLLASVNVFLVGCNKNINYKNRAVVKGKVTTGGVALTAGTVVFYGNDNITSTAVIDKNGEYVMNDAPVGNVKITVSVPPLPPAGLESMRGKSPIMGEMPDKIVPISNRYATVETSELTYTVEKGEHVKNLDLKP
jgi:hypothetical protein